MAKEIKQTSLDLSNVRTHGRSYVGRVISDKMNATVIVAWDRKIFVPKYERYMVRKSKVNAHNPDSISAREGDIVRIKQCRPLSKTKNFIVVEKLGSSEDVIEESAKSSEDAKESSTKEQTKSVKKSESKKTEKSKDKTND